MGTWLVGSVGLSTGGTPGLGVGHIFWGPLKPEGWLPLSLPAAKYHRRGGLEMTEIYFSQFRRLEVGDQGASTVKFCVG